MRQRLELGRGGPEPVPAASRGISPAIYFITFALLFATNVATGVAFLFTSEIAGVVNGRSDVVIAAYEDRIVQLRLEVDRLYSRQYAQAGDINLQLQDLSAQQALLIEQHQYVKALAAKAVELGLSTPAPVADHADADLAGAISVSGGGQVADIAQATAAVDSMMEESREALVGISSAAEAQTKAIAAEFDRLGLKLDLPASTTIGVGGPLLPAREGPDATGLADDANAAMAALVRFKAARGAIEGAPVHMPITENFRYSSGFGNRTDPFTGGKAFHAGMDFAAPSGTMVLAAGAGTVVFVGERSGYGKVVEIDHGNGIMTRYAHLSAWIAVEGQKVQSGTPIAKVGSTGRSTGPHLHFEVRKSGDAVNPNGFLDAGKRMLAILGA